METALEHLDKSPRELAWHLTDTEGYFISESSVYRILKLNGLVTSPAYTVLSAKDKFDQPTTRVNQLWQTDFTYLKIVHWGWPKVSVDGDGRLLATEGPGVAAVFDDGDGGCDGDDQ